MQKQHHSSNDDGVVPKQKKATLFSKAKKNLAGKVVASAFGKDALKSILDEETREKFALFKQLMVSEFGEEKAGILEEDIIRLIVKGYILSFVSFPFPLSPSPSYWLRRHFAYENGIINPDELPKLQDLVKKICYLLTGMLPPQSFSLNKFLLRCIPNDGGSK